MLYRKRRPFFVPSGVMIIAEIVRLLVGGVDYAPFVDISSVQATNNVEMNQDGMSFAVVLDRGVPRPRAGQEVVWQRWDTVTSTETSREFAGVLTSVTENVEGANIVYECDCQSYLRWFDRRLVTGYYQQQAAETTIKQVVGKYAPGFSTEYVKARIDITAQYFNYQRPSNAVKVMVDQIGFGWYIDYYKRLHVYALEDFQSPLPNNILDVDHDYENYGDLVLTEDAEQVFNRFTIRGFKRRSDAPYTLYFTGDGRTNQWSLGYRVSSAKGDVVVTVDGEEYTVKRDILEGIPGQGGEPGVAYIHFTQHLVRFASPPASGATIAVTFYYLVDRTFIDQDDASIAYMRQLERTDDGVFEYAEQNKSLSQSTTDAIRSHVELLALKHGFPTMVGTFTSFTPGWRAGQSFRMVSQYRMCGNDSKVRYYVNRVTKRWIQPMHDGERPIQYTIEFADKPYLV